MLRLGLTSWLGVGNQLAFSLGVTCRCGMPTGDIAATLNFDASSVLGLDWRPDGQYLAIGYQGVKIWNSQDWDDDPYILDIRRV